MVVAVVAVIVSAWFVRFRIQQSRRNAAYELALGPFKRNLAEGTVKEEVEAYLRSHKIAYNEVRIGGHPAETLEVKIGEDPSTMVCDWDVYVAMDFTKEDRLNKVYILREGTCL